MPYQAEQQRVRHEIGAQATRTLVRQERGRAEESNARNASLDSAAPLSRAPARRCTGIMFRPSGCHHGAVALSDHPVWLPPLRRSNSAAHSHDRVVRALLRGLRMRKASTWLGSADAFRLNATVPSRLGCGPVSAEPTGQASCFWVPGWRCPRHVARHGGDVPSRGGTPPQ